MMFLRFDLMAKAVMLNLARSKKDFDMLFIKIYDDFGMFFFKTHDDKKARRRMKENTRKVLTFVIS